MLPVLDTYNRVGVHALCSNAHCCFSGDDSPFPLSIARSVRGFLALFAVWEENFLLRPAAFAQVISQGYLLVFCDSVHVTRRPRPAGAGAWLTVCCRDTSWQQRNFDRYSIRGVSNTPVLDSPRFFAPPPPQPRIVSSDRLVRYSTVDFMILWKAFSCRIWCGCGTW